MHLNLIEDTRRVQVDIIMNNTEMKHVMIL